MVPNQTVIVIMYVSLLTGCALDILFGGQFYSQVLYLKLALWAPFPLFAIALAFRLPSRYSVQYSLFLLLFLVYSLSWVWGSFSINPSIQILIVCGTYFFCVHCRLSAKSAKFVRLIAVFYALAAFLQPFLFEATRGKNSSAMAGIYFCLVALVLGKTHIKSSHLGACAIIILAILTYTFFDYRSLLIQIAIFTVVYLGFQIPGLRSILKKLLPELLFSIVVMIIYVVVNLDLFYLTLEKYLPNLFFDRTLKSGREIIWPLILDVTSSQPLLGLGSGFLPSEVLINEDWSGHNQYLQMFAQVGLAGILILIILFHSIWKHITVNQHKLTFAGAAFSIILISNSTEVTLFQNLLAIGLLQWTVLANLSLPVVSDTPEPGKKPKSGTG